MEIYLPTADGDVIMKWDKEFVAEMLNRKRISNMVNKTRTINIF